ncbi:MAG: hypothetical protein Q4F97_07615 [Bacteroidales bacterium]|nr:hypothetical protein [Bacteroidales bacterium]
MKAVKDLLLSELTSKGFIYYPELKRLMHKVESSNDSEVTIVEMNQDNLCRVYFSKNTDTDNVKQISEDKSFDYDFNKIVSFINALPTNFVSQNSFLASNLSKVKTAA